MYPEMSIKQRQLAVTAAEQLYDGDGLPALEASQSVSLDLDEEVLVQALSKVSYDHIISIIFCGILYHQFLRNACLKIT